MDGLKLVDDYIKWYKENTTIKDFDNYSELTTPYVNHLNDRIRLYVEAIPENKIRISDDGQTLNELELIGIDLSSKTRKQIIYSILRQFGTSINDDIISIESSIKDFPKAKHKLIQSIIRIYDLLNTKRTVITKLFTEEVQNYFFDADLGGTPNVKLTGQSGIDYQVDYVLGARKNRSEVWFQTINHFDFNSFTTLDFIYRDISLGRESTQKAKKVLIFNDVDNKPAQKAIQAIENTDIKAIPWSQKDAIIEYINS